VRFEQRHFVHTNNYANYSIQNDFNISFNNTGKAFIVNNSLSSFLNQAQQGAPYIEFIKKTLFQQLQLRNKSILVIGAGGFTLSVQNHYDNHFTYIDIDDDIARVAEQHFINHIDGDFIGEDARHYLQQTQERYDVVVSDAYKDRIAIPAYLLTQEYFLGIRNVLQDDGIAIFNLIAKPFLDDAYSKRIDNTISSIFPSCMKTPLNFSDRLENIVYVCKKSTQEYDKIVYTDDLNPATLDFFSAEANE